MFIVQPRPCDGPSQSPGLQHSVSNNHPLPTVKGIEHSRANSVSVTERFGHRLRELRRERGMTQIELADYLGIDRAFISDVERGKKAMSLGYLHTVAQGFKLSLAELMTGV